VALVKLERFDEAAQTFRAILPAIRGRAVPRRHLALAFAAVEQIRASRIAGGRCARMGSGGERGNSTSSWWFGPADPQATNLLERLRHLTP